MRRLLGLTLFLFCALCWADQYLEPVLTSQSRVLAAPDRVIVRFPHVAARRAAVQMGYQVLRDIPQLGYVVLKTPYGQVDETIVQLKAKGLVQEAFPDRAYRIAYVPNDPLVPSQWNLFQMNVPAAWDLTQGRPEVVVAVLDTGVDYNHPELAPNIWHNPGEIPGNGIDDDGNGFVDDDLGWDFAYGDRDPMDDHGHGTACAGIIAAAGDNGFQMAGIAYRCRVMCVKIGLSNGYSYDSMFAPGVVYAADMGAKVQSISYFSDDLTPLLRAAVDYAWRKGCLVVAAAGNFDEPFPIYPAGYDKAVAVAATTSADRKASFSNFGTWVDVSAPGVSIVATTWGGGYTDRFAGTSAATPNAAGVAASALVSAAQRAHRAYPYGTGVFLTTPERPCGGLFLKLWAGGCLAGVATVAPAGAMVPHHAVYPLDQPASYPLHRRHSDPLWAWLWLGCWCGKSVAAGEAGCRPVANGSFFPAACPPPAARATGAGVERFAHCGACSCGHGVGLATGAGAR